jgi:AAHS family 4-hydroxybenzoate transporter-like MFS transporter
VAFVSCLLAVYIGFNWLPTLLSSNGLSISAASRGLAAFNLGGVLAALAGAALIVPFGSKRTMLTMAAIAVGGAIALMAMSIHAEETVAVVAAIGVMGGAINGVQTLLYALGAHVYPTAVRATGVGSASAVGRFGAIASVFVGTWALAAGDHRTFFLVVAAAMTSTFIALACLRKHVPPLKQSSPEVSS